MPVCAVHSLSVAPYEDGAAFGDTGTYEVVRGILRYAVDPDAPASRRVVDQIQVGRDVMAVAAGAGSVWAVRGSRPTLLQISPASGEIVRRIPVGNGARALAVYGGRAWVANALDATVSEVDTDSGRVRAIEVGAAPSAVGRAASSSAILDSCDGPKAVDAAAANLGSRMIRGMILRFARVVASTRDPIARPIRVPKTRRTRLPFGARTV